MLTLHRHADTADFLAHAESFLLAAEGENVLMLGICMQKASGEQSLDSCYLATVDGAGAVVACALRTPPYSAVVTRAGRPALDLLVTDLLCEYPDLPTAVGPEPSITAFAELWSERTGVAVLGCPRLWYQQTGERLRLSGIVAVHPWAAPAGCAAAYSSGVM